MDWTLFGWACGLTIGGLVAGVLVGALRRRPPERPESIRAAQETLSWFLEHEHSISVWSGRYSIAECRDAMRLLAHTTIVSVPEGEGGSGG